MGIRVLRSSGSEGDLDGALGGVDAGADHLAVRARDLAGAQVADLAGAQLARRRCGRCPCGSRRAASRRPPRRRRGSACAPSLRASTPLLVKRIVPPSPCSASPLPMIGWKRSMCRRVASRPRAPSASTSASSISAGPADERLALAPVGAELGRGRSGVMRPCSPVSCTCRRKPGWRVVQRAQLVAEDHVVRGARGVEVHDVVEVLAALEAAQHAHDRRDPAAGADEEQLRRQRVGQHERPLDAAEADDRRPAARALHEVGRDLALLDELRGDPDAAVGAAGVGGQRVGAPVVDAVDDHADAQVLAGLVARPLPARA